MVDLKSQYQKIKSEIDAGIQDVIDSTRFIKGPVVQKFEESLSQYMGVKHSIGCANGTDALQIALMALGLEQGDEVIVPTFTYVATAEVIALLKLKPVMADVDPNTFNITAEEIKKRITSKTKAIVPVHLYGQTANMESIMEIANKYNLYVIEDNAQAIGSNYTFSDGTVKKAGTIGHIGTTSFFPSKNLGCYGDGGAIFTNDDELAKKIKVIANHGQAKKYYHDEIGINSRLDAIQAAILNVKLKYLDDYISNRQTVASGYDKAFGDIDGVQIPVRSANSTHVFHQYTLQVPSSKRNELQDYLKEKGVPSMIYYPLPLFKQKAYQDNLIDEASFKHTNKLCECVISLPIHTEMSPDILAYICSTFKEYFN